MTHIRTENYSKALKMLTWKDSNRYWGQTAFDDLGRQIEYSDYSGFYRKTEYYDDGSIDQICNNGLTFSYTPNHNGKFICKRVNNENASR